MGLLTTTLLPLLWCILVNAQFDLNPTTDPVSCVLGDGSQGECVMYYLCDQDSNTTITDGKFLLDIRAYGECAYTEMCCGLPNKVETPITPAPPVTQRPPLPSTTCGVRNPTGVGFSIQGNNNNEAQFGEFPWMIAILREENLMVKGKNLYVYQCGGSLIHPKVVMTAAHCVSNFTNTPKRLRIRAGEYDTLIQSEFLPHQDRSLSSIVVHEKYYFGGLFFDIALLILETPMDLAGNVGVVCLPPEAQTVSPATCFATGWGKDKFGKNGTYQNILKKMDLPIVPHEKCQRELRETRLGVRYILHRSFVCAGGVVGKDVCTGDGGAPLVCPIPTDPNRYMQVGIVSWGIGCSTKTPGVYANVPHLRSWIDDNLLLYNIDMSAYNADTPLY